MKLNKNILISFIVVIGSTFLFNYTFNKPTIINKYIKTHIFSTPANTAFTDDNFYSRVIMGYQSANNVTINGATSLTDEQLATIKSISASGANINNVDGIEKLINVENLGLNENNINQINLTNNTKLYSLSLGRNNLTSIDLSKNTELETLHISENQLNNLDLTNNSKLSTLYVYGNNIEELDLSKNPLLTNIRVDNIIIDGGEKVYKESDNYIMDFCDINYINTTYRNIKSSDLYTITSGCKLTINNLEELNYIETSYLLDGQGGTCVGCSYGNAFKFKVNKNINTLSINNSYDDIDSVSCTTLKDLSCKVETPVISREGYELKGYNDTVNETTYLPNEIIEINNNDSVEAIWEANKYNGTYDYTNETFEVTYDRTYGELLTPTKKGYTFKGWYLEDTFENQVTEDTIVKTASNHTLYAKWEINSYKLIIDSTGGTYEGETELIINYNESIEITNPTRVGYTFKGWELIGEESTIDGTTFTMGISDTTLTAIWEANKYEVTYDYTNETFEVTYDEAYGELLTPTKKGYTFKGWYLEDTFENQVTVDTIVKTASNHTLYAKWEINSYKLTINSNGGVYNGEKELIINYNESIEINNPTRIGYEFKGWEVSGEESTINKTIFTMGISDSSLTAIWEIIKPDGIENSEYVIKGNMITNVELETNIEDFNLILNSIYTLKIISNKTNAEKTKGLIATGDKVQIYLDDTLVVEYVVSIKGDVSGDGKSSVADFSKAYQFLKGRIDMEDWFIEAADVVKNDSEITMADVSKIYQFIKNRISSLD